MKHFAVRAFTLIELLVVITIIAVLTGIALPVFNSVQLKARQTQSLSNMRQLGIELIAYCADNNGQLPTEGDSAPTWAGAAANNSTENTAWYNVLPRNYGKQKGVGDFAGNPADFYTKNSLFYVPSAVYPSNKLNAPLFAVVLCSKLFDSALVADSSLVRLQNFTNPTETCIFQESGLPGEKPIYPNQSAYNGQSKSFASRSIARYGGNTVMVFADGHAGIVSGKDIVDPTTGKAYFPQVSPTTGKVYWTMNASANANN